MKVKKDTLTVLQRAIILLNQKRDCDEKKKGYRVKKKKWVSDARKEFNHLITDKKTCFVCEKYKAMAEAHHIYPLAMQYDDGIKIPFQDFIWLCPTHHSALHLLIEKGSIFNFINAEDLLSDFTREEVDRISALNKAFVSLKFGV